MLCMCGGWGGWGAPRRMPLAGMQLRPSLHPSILKHSPQLAPAHAAHIHPHHFPSAASPLACNSPSPPAHSPERRSVRGFARLNIDGFSAHTHQRVFCTYAGPYCMLHICWSICTYAGPVSGRSTDPRAEGESPGAGVFRLHHRLHPHHVFPWCHMVLPCNSPSPPPPLPKPTSACRPAWAR